MNGLDLHDRTKALADELEKAPKLALAWALATATLTSARVLLAADKPAAADEEAARMKEHVSEYTGIARSVYARRRYDRLIKELDNPGKKRRKKKRRAKRGRRS